MLDSQFKITGDNGRHPRIVADLEIVELFAGNVRELVAKDSEQTSESGESHVVARILTKCVLTILARLKTDILSAGRYCTIVSDTIEWLSEYELQYRNRYTFALSQFGRQIISSFDVHEVMKLAVKSAARTLCRKSSIRLSQRSLPGSAGPACGAWRYQASPWEVAC